MSSSFSRFLTEDPHQRLGARGAAEVKWMSFYVINSSNEL